MTYKSVTAMAWPNLVQRPILKMHAMEDRQDAQCAKSNTAVAAKRVFPLFLVSVRKKHI